MHLILGRDYNLLFSDRNSGEMFALSAIYKQPKTSFSVKNDKIVVTLLERIY